MELRTAALPVPRLFGAYHNAPVFAKLCSQCPGFGKTWACPPYDFTTEEIFSGKTQAFIIAVKAYTETAGDAPSLQKDINKTSKRFLDDIRMALDARLLELEKANGGSFALFAGSCANCPERRCPRREGKPCAHPDKMRYSLESLGFDVNAISRDELGIPLLWGKDGSFPEYFTLISALVLAKDSDISEKSFGGIF